MTTGDPSEPSRNLETVHRLFDTFNRGDGDAARELWTEDGEWRPYILGGIVEGAVYRGRHEIVEFISGQAETWERVSATPVEMRDLGDRVLVQVRLDGVGRASGLAVDGVTWNVFKLRDGRVAAGRVYATRADALAALGVSE
jgi:ketosteroid isomerase-like protein